MNKDYWIEDISGTVCYKPTYKIKESIFKKRSTYQEIEIVVSPLFGKILLLDNVLQVTEADEFIYHEMLVHIPLLTHPSPQKVCIIGGGDGCTLREVIKHPIKEAKMIELDGDVVSVSEEYLKFSGDPYKDKRVELIIGEGSATLEREKPYDVILVDSTDPVGEAMKLFSSQFYKSASDCLTDNGMISVQSGSPIFQPDLLNMVVNNMSKIFPFVKVYTAFVPTYPGIYWSFALGEKKDNFKDVKKIILKQRITELGLKFKYYNPDIHFATFVLPEFVKDIISGKKPYGIFSTAPTWDSQH